MSLVRTYRGYKVGISESKHQLLRENLTDAFFEQVEKDFNDEKKLTPIKNHVTSTEYIEQMYYQYLQEHVYYSMDEFKKEVETCEIAKKSYSYLLQLVNRLSEKHKYVLENKESLILDLHNTLAIKLAMPNEISICLPRKQNFINKVKSLDHKLYEDIYKGMYGYCELMTGDVRSNQLINLIFNVYLRWNSLFIQLSITDKRVHAYFLSDLDAGLTDEGIRLLNHYYGDSCEFDRFEFLDNKPPKDVDFVISTYPVHPKHFKRVIQINDFPTRRDLLNIQKMIYEIQQKHG